MKPYPNKELLAVTILLLMTGVVCLGASGLALRLYWRLCATPWDSLFRTEQIYHTWIAAFAWIFFGAFPGMALVCFAGSWALFRARSGAPNLP